METVIQALEKMGRATYREVAARLDIEPVEALNMLREQREQGLCDFSDGGWFVGKLKGQAQVAKPAATAKSKLLQGAEPEPVDPEAISQLLDHNTTMTTAALAKAVGRNARGMTMVLVSLARQGVVVKNGQGKGVTWSLPTAQVESNEAPVLPVEPVVITAPEVADPVQPSDIAQIVSEIPSFTEGRATLQTVPTVRVISREIRRTKSKLANLEILRDAVRVVGRHKHLVQQLVNAEGDHAKTKNA
ncbi:hypothetical protein C3Z09_15240 [Lelliottia aquatilis]|nr:hypothetical protein C3Z09_15240 [Lelliottia aquatilis]